DLSIASWRPLSRDRSSKNRLLHHTAPTLRSGVPSRRRCSREDRADGPSWPAALDGHPWPSPHYAMPLLGLLKSRLAAPELACDKIKSRAGRCAPAGARRGKAMAFWLAVPAYSRASPLPQGVESITDDGACRAPCGSRFTGDGLQGSPRP